MFIYGSALKFNFYAFYWNHNLQCAFAHSKLIVCVLKLNLSFPVRRDI